MDFLNPYWLWGTLAVAIPILIHFWHQKRGTVIAWAATQWLVEKNQQQQRGLKFDNWLLLLLRSLIVLLLALLLSQPVADWLAKTNVAQPMHLVQPDALLVNNFRFELETALKKGEKVYWVGAGTDPVTTLALPRLPDKLTVLSLQAAINQLRQDKSPLHLYVVNAQQLADVPFIYVSTRFRLHSVVDSVPGLRNFLPTKQTRLFVNGAGRLINGADLPQNVRFASSSMRGEPLAVLIRFRDKTERQTVGAALDALTDVYKLVITVDDQPQSGKRYDVVLTDQTPTDPSAETLYIVSGAEQPSMDVNVIHTSEPFRGPSAVAVSGQLPEWLGERLVTYFGLNPANVPLSQPQLNALFVPEKRFGKKHSGEDSPTTRGGLLLVFVMLIGAERWLALTKNA